MWYPAIRRAFESFSKPQDSAETRQAGAYEFVDAFRRDLGLSFNENGRPIRGQSSMSPREFSIRGLAESLCGYEWVENLGHSSANARRVFEAGGNPAITPGNLPNVSAYLGAVAGLLDAGILEGYDKPDFKIDDLIPTEPSKTRQRVMIGTGRIGDQARRRNPGEGHEFVQFAERKTITGETYNDALAGSVTFEAVFYDQTGQILDEMNGIGDELGLRKELDGFRLIAGITNPYNYNSVAYNTYLTTGNWVNQIANNLVDWTDVNVVNAMFSRMTDQETGNRIAVDWDTLLCSPMKELTAKYIQTATEVESRTASGTVQSRAPKLGDTKKIVTSVYMEQVLTSTAANGGLGLAQEQADQYWWALKTDKRRSAFVRTENWPVTINRASPTDFNMLNQKLLLAVFADQMHSFDVRDPRLVIECINE
jgi:hypothetical protein